MSAPPRLTLAFLAPLVLALALASCGKKESATSEPDQEPAPAAGVKSEPPIAPEPPTPDPGPEPAAGPSQEEVTAGLQAQEFGRKLLGKTVILQDDKFVSADLRRVPEFYLVHWSASW